MNNNNKKFRNEKVSKYNKLMIKMTKRLTDLGFMFLIELHA